MNHTDESLQEMIDQLVSGYDKHPKPVYSDKVKTSVGLQKPPADWLDGEEGIFDAVPSGMLAKYLEDYKLYEKYHVDLPKKIAEELISRCAFRVDGDCYVMVLSHSTSGKQKELRVKIFKTYEYDVVHHNMPREVAEEALAEMEDRLNSNSVDHNQLPIFTRIRDRLRSFLRKK